MSATNPDPLFRAYRNWARLCAAIGRREDEVEERGWGLGDLDPVDPDELLTTASELIVELLGWLPEFDLNILSQIDREEGR